MRGGGVTLPIFNMILFISHTQWWLPLQSMAGIVEHPIVDSPK